MMLGGNYQALINKVLREYLQKQNTFNDNKSLESTLRKMIRDELYDFKQAV
jgi:hypothetical protein